MELKIFTDGGSRGNPGLSACAFVIYSNNKIIAQNGKKLGIATNNFAEYSAVVEAFVETKNIVKKNPSVYTKILVCSDSNLLVNQLSGLFKIKNAVIRDFIFKIKILESEINLPIIYMHIPREKNSYADSIVNKTLDS